MDKNNQDESLGSPNKRYNVEQCLSHPYFEGLHDPEQDPTSESTFNFSFDS